ncbi:hypothetical protein KXJ69_11085 [Aureisphaera sp. CAU 1614]|uniref:Uncharacterized protein n=1 Tax=Halomarinibacterium sedimenti TaxID=2857106 RepID=A0A9X1FRA8_9FLAO|nr:hypothetical protein [Halomarinibacterium sedimenti]MBW2938654.1 hypothetical protein [Halomarinibacterium sedimenti]
MKFFLFISIFISAFCSLSAQFDSNTNFINASNGTSSNFGIQTVSNNSNFARVQSYGAKFDDGSSGNDPDTVGSPYMNDEYQLGSIIKDSLVYADNIAVKYQVLEDYFIGKLSLTTNDEEARVIIKSQDYKIKMGDKLFVALPSIENSGNLEYFQILVIGNKGTLYKKNKKIFKPRIMATTSLTKNSPPTFKDDEEYYFGDFNGNFTKVPTSKKKILELFENNKKEVSAVIKKNKLNLKKEEDLIRLFRFYETL